jgi:signal transduction histidine kinase
MGEQMSDEHRAYPILYVDDEPQNLFAFRYALEDRFTVLTANDPREAMRVLEREDIAVLMCDQRMPQMTGVEVCRRAREIKPDVVRIMVTAYADMQAAVDAINQGQVLRYLTKPWRNDELVEVLQSAIEMVRLRRMVHEMQTKMLRGGHPPVIEALARQIASELQTPLSALAMNTEQVGDLLTAGLSSWQSPARAEELVRHARETQRDSEPPMDELKRIVDRLERGQRLSSAPEPAISDAGRVVHATARILGPAFDSRTRLQLVISGSLLVPMGAAELGQVLVHLITNAADAAARVPGAEPSTITVRVAETGPWVELSVVDAGPGIAVDQLERIFDPYVTTREGAAGLGLAVVRHLVTQAGGSVWAESQVGLGARLVVKLPLAG